MIICECVLKFITSFSDHPTNGCRYQWVSAVGKYPSGGDHKAGYRNKHQCNVLIYAVH